MQKKVVAWIYLLKRKFDGTESSISVLNSTNCVIILIHDSYRAIYTRVRKYFRGQQLAQQMQNTNPELIESLRRQMGGNPNDPEPPQQN